MNQIIATDTTWGPGSVHTLSADVQVAQGATLTIQAGAEVNGNGHTIDVFGTLAVAGVSGNDVAISDTSITEGSDYTHDASINVDYATLVNGSFMGATGNAVYGEFSLTNSILANQRAMYIWYPTGNSLIQGNYFVDDGGLSVGTSGSVTVTVDHNTFVDWTGNLYSDAAIEDWASYQSSNLSVSNNNFLSSSAVVLELPPGYDSASMTAYSNYYGTSDPAKVSSLLYDKSVDLSSGAFITNASIQYSPVANAGQAPAAVSIGGGVAGQAVSASGSLTPFETVSIVDPNAVPDVVVSVTLSAPGNGTLSNLAGGSYDVAHGIYSVSGALATVQAVLDGLVFTPNPLATPPGTSADTGFTIAVNDGLAAPASDAATSVVVSNPAIPVPDVGALLSPSSENVLQNALASLSPSGTVANVARGPGATTIPAVASALNALVIDTASAGSEVSVPTGYQVGYLLGDSGTELADQNGNALLVACTSNATLVGAANDTLIGGDAATTFVPGNGATTIIGGAGSNLIALGGSIAVVMSHGTDTITGSTGDTTITSFGPSLYFGASGPVTFNAQGGTPTLVGGEAATVNAGASAMLLFGGQGALAFNAGSGASTVVSGSGSTATIMGGSAPLLYFGNGASTYSAGTAVDTVLGFTGSLTATGGANGTVFFTGTAGNNSVSTGPGSSTVIGFGANDVLTATGDGANVIAAAADAATINGTQAGGSNTFFAFGNNDVVIGGAGQTAIESGLGNHTLVAGSGSTLFEILAGTPGRALSIANFDSGRDFVQLQGYGAGAGSVALQSATLAGGSETVALSDGTRVTFQGVVNLGASSFV